MSTTDIAGLTEPATSRFADLQVGEQAFRIHYNDCGPASPAGEVVVMLHGSGPGASGWANFHANVPAFVAAGHRVILMDCPGWSKSDTVLNRGSRSQLNADTLKALLDHLGIARVHIVGNSMGGHSAVAFALSHPTQVGKLVLMGGGTGGTGVLAPQPMEGIKLIGALYRNPTLENLQRMMQVFVFDASAITPAMMETRLANMLARPEHLQNFVRSLEANPRQFPDVGHRLGEIAAPTLIIWGRDDRFVPLETGLRLVAGLPRADLHVYSRCGHWAQWEHADKFNRQVLTFLAG